MNDNNPSLAQVFEGWEGYNTSLVHAVAPLTPDQLNWRPSPWQRSVGELVRHISLGRLEWFARMDAPGSSELAQRVSGWEADPNGSRYIVEDSLAITQQAEALAGWLEDTWQMIADLLAGWRAADLFQSYRHIWNGQPYAVSRQWTIFRILAHDIHHGGGLSLMLGTQGIEALELSELGGHILLPPLAETSETDPE